MQLSLRISPRGHEMLMDILSAARTLSMLGCSLQRSSEARRTRSLIDEGKCNWDQVWIFTSYLVSVCQSDAVTSEQSCSTMSWGLSLTLTCSNSAICIFSSGLNTQHYSAAVLQWCTTAVRLPFLLRADILFPLNFNNWNVETVPQPALPAGASSFCTCCCSDINNKLLVLNLSCWLK